MAYLDLSGAFRRAPDFSSPVTAPVVEERTRLGALEWSVVALARYDRLSTLTQPGRLALAVARVFGTPTYGRQLADPALEALRHMAVLYWHCADDVSAADRDAFFSAGFTPGQYRTMTASIRCEPGELRSCPPLILSARR